NRQLIVSLVAAVASFVVSTVAAHAQVVAPNLPAGTPYRVVFASTNSYQAYNSTIPSQTRSLSYWQNIVDAEAAASSSPTITGATFRLVGSIFDGSTTVNATTITGMSATVSDNIPVYNTLGQLVATDSVSFWSATHQAGINGDRNGNTVTGSAWIGFFPTLQTFRPFGGTNVYFGGVANTNPWINSTLGGTNFLRVYAISEPISTIPTPGAAALIGLGGLAMARRRR
ncbi:MAG: hypothetical protein K2X32_07575, partial [Phycisphaerales bacterium]|nr:hypothetical protein [Phycisphaerales bacterium]